MVEAGKREEKCKEQQEEIRIRQEIKECEAAAAREADRERKRERARRAKEGGPDAMRKGKYPHCTQYSTPSATISIKNYDFISSFSGVGLYL
jgi:septal ring factor EnvC (AmiA/AmiB activator)